MSSSLASQLANVRSYNAERLSASSAIASKASYLFPPKAAVQQDLYTVHALATSGWNELCADDASLAHWHRGTLLFGEESRQKDRLMLSQDENQEIDDAIRDFLQRIGAVLLSKGASKCLEWLVRRFRVHEFSVDDILAAFLPYHETPQFARMLSICKIEGRPHLQFLLAVQKTNSPLPSSVLQTALLAPTSTTASLDLLRWVAGLVHAGNSGKASAPMGVQPHRILVGFWTSTLVQMCVRWAGQQREQLGGGLSRSTSNKKKSVKAREADAQSILTVLLPSAVQVASSSELGLDAQVGGYMLLCSVASAFPLSRQAVQGIFGSLAKGLLPDHSNVHHPALSRARLAASYTLCASPEDAADPLTLQTQATDRLMPDSLTRVLVPSASELLAMVKKSALAYNVEPFVAQLLSALIVRLADDPSASLLEALLLLPTTSEDLIAKVLGILLELPLSSNDAAVARPEVAGYGFVRHLPEELLPVARTNRVKVLAGLRQRRSGLFDVAVKAATSGESQGSKRLAAVWQVVRSVMSVEAGASFEAAANGGIDSETNVLWLAIHSADAAQRRLALQQLLGEISAGKVSASDTMVRDALQSRIGDSSEAVLKTLYSAPQSLLDALDGATLLEAVTHALAAARSMGVATLSHHIHFLLVSFIPAHESLSSQAIQTALWPHLLWTSTHRQAAETCSRLIAQSKLKASSTAGALLAGAAKAGQTESIESAAANDLIASLLASHVVAIKDDRLKQSWVNFVFDQAASENTASSASVTAEAAASQRSSQILASLVLIRMLSLVDEHRFQRYAGRAIARIADPLLAQPEVEPEQQNADGADPSKLAAAARGAISADLHALIYRSTFTSQTLRRLAGELLQQVALGLRMPKLSVVLAGGQARGSSGAEQSKDTSAVGLLVSLYAMANTASTGVALSKQLLQTLFLRLRDSVLPFLANVWTHARTETATVRLAALRHASAYLQAFATEGLAKDFQVIVPALLIPLADPEASIRMAALTCLEDVLAVCQTAGKGAPSGNSKGKNLEVFGYDAIYGESASKDLQYLDLASLVRYLGELLSRRSAFRNDAHFLPQLHKDLLNVNKQDGRKDVNYKFSILCFLCSHIVCWQDAPLRLALLESLQGVSDASKLSTLLPLVRNLVQNAKGPGFEDATDRRRYAELLFACYDQSCRSVLEDAANGSWKLFLAALGGGSDGSNVQTPAVLALQRGGGLFAAIQQSMRQEAYQHLATVVADPAKPASAEAQACLRELDVDASILASVLSELRTTITVKALEAPEAKRARTSLGSDETVRRAAAVLVVILESASGKKLARSGALVFEFFEVLRVSVELHSSLAINAEYMLQLSMTCLSNLVDGYDSTSAPADIVQSLRADTIVSAIKASHNPQTFQHALLLLSRVANIAPEPVLHNVMPIFTFVGSTVLQRDDAFSYTVVEKTLKSIVPALVESLKRRQPATDGSEDGRAHFALLCEARAFIRVFTDAAHYVPKHRRQVFFKLLVEILGAVDFGAAICMLLVDRSAFKIAKQPRQDVEQTMQLPLAVIQAQPAITQLLAVNQIWAEVLRIWTHRHDFSDTLSEHVFLDRAGRMDKEHTDKQAEPIRQIQALILYIRQVLDSKVFAAQFESRSVSVAATKELGARFEEFVRSALVASDPLSLEQASINSLAQEALTAAMPFVPIANVMNVVTALTQSGSDAPRKASGFSLFASRVAALDAKHEDRRAVATYTANVIGAALDVLRTSAPSSDALRQAALDAIKSISATALASEHGALASAIPVLVSVGQATDRVPISSQIAVFSISRRLADKLGPRLIPHLSKLVPFCLSTVQASMATPSPSTAAATTTVSGGLSSSLRTGAFDTLSGLFGSVPTFMTGYVSEIIRASISPELKVAMASQSGSSTASERSLNALLSSLIKRTPAQSLFESIVAIWDQALSSTDAALRSSRSLRLTGLFDFLSRALRQTDRTAMAQTYKAVFRFLLKALDLRRTQREARAAQSTGEEEDDDDEGFDVDSVEDHAIQSLLKMVLKLNESSFRPLFLRLSDWAVLDLVDDDTPPNDAGLVARQVVLYKTFNALSDQLRGLVSSYYSVLLDHSVELLQHFGKGRIGRAGSDGEDGRHLWTALMASLQKSARYDEGSFWTASRANKVIPALLMQTSLVAGSGGGGGAGKDRLTLPIDELSSQLVRATTAISHAVPVESVLKTLNASLLSLSSSARSTRNVRIVTLRVLTAVWGREGEAMLSLVPETVAQVSELLDDDERTIAEEAAKFREKIELALGESLDAYLS